MFNAQANQFRKDFLCQTRFFAVLLDILPDFDIDWLLLLHSYTTSFY